jgi:hypothetical protein
MIATYSGDNVNPLPSFEGEPPICELPFKNVRDAALGVYKALAPVDGNDFRVSLAAFFIDGEKPLFLEKKAAQNYFFGKCSPKKEGGTVLAIDEKNRLDQQISKGNRRCSSISDSAEQSGHGRYFLNEGKIDHYIINRCDESPTDDLWVSSSKTQESASSSPPHQTVGITEEDSCGGR